MTSTTRKNLFTAGGLAVLAVSVLMFIGVIVFMGLVIYTAFTD